MFGYTVPSYSRLPASDLSVYRRYYCETCHQLRDGYGLLSTATVNYDMTFNTLVLEGASGDAKDFEGTEQGPLCVFQHSKSGSRIFQEMACYTVILTKWELHDDEVDDPSAKTKAISFALGKAIRKAESERPEYDEAVGEAFGRLRDLEQAGCRDAVRMGRTFGDGLAVPLMEIVGGSASDDLRELFVWLTAAVYAMDAADDLEQDFMEGTYNPFIGDRSRFVNRERFLAEHLREVTGAVSECVGGLQDTYSRVRPTMTANTGVCDNIVYLGIAESAKNAVQGTGIAKLSVKNALDRRRERNEAR